MANAKKNNEDKVNYIDTTLKLLTLIPLIWILYQIRALYIVQNLWWYPFFSWTQVINDTVWLSPFTLPTIAAIVFWVAVMHYLEKQYSSIKKNKWTKIILIFIVWLLLWVAFSAILGLLLMLIVWEFKKDTFFVFMKLYGFYYFISSLVKLIQIVSSSNKENQENKIVWLTLSLIIWTILSMFSLYIIFPIYLESTNKSLCIARESDLLIPVLYMNDKFAFYSWAILSDSKHEFMWTWVLVIWRKDDDKFVRCKKETEIKKIQTSVGYKKE